MKTSGWIAAAAIFVGAGVVLLTRNAGDEPMPSEPVTAVDATDAPSASVVMPSTLGPAAEAGRIAFVDNCAECHGQNGGGTNQGPPLIHIIYETGHHADIAFYLAAQNGVRAHHWRFGNMPPQPQVTDREIADIIQFVREVQRTNGIF